MIRTPPQIRSDLRALDRPTRTAKKRLARAEQDHTHAKTRGASIRTIAIRRNAEIEATNLFLALGLERHALERELCRDWAPLSWSGNADG